MIKIRQPGQPRQKRSAEYDAELWYRLRGKYGDDAIGPPVGGLNLSGRSIPKFKHHIQPVIPGAAKAGEQLLQGQWRLGSARVEAADGAAPWSVAPPTRSFADWLHGFEWAGSLLRQGESGAERLKWLVDDWIEQFGRFHGFVWRADCTTERVWSWLCCGNVLFEQDDKNRLRRRIVALDGQIKHVAACLEEDVSPQARWRGCNIAVINAVNIRGGRGLDASLAALETECAAQFFPDGGHVSRSPERALMSLADLMIVQEALVRSKRKVPDFIERWIQRIGSMTAFFVSGDGALLPFNDGDQSRREVVNAVLNRLPIAPRRFSIAPKSGFHKLSNGQTMLVLDTGPGPEQPYGDKAHSGALGFEMNDGAARIVTSCGSSRTVDIDFQEAVRRTAAHSTLIISNRESTGFSTNDESRLLYPIGPSDITAKRLEEENEVWLDAQHGGYRDRFGFLHQRRLFMTADGGRLTGEDSLARPVTMGESDITEMIPFCLRFHLHPTVAARLDNGVVELNSDAGPVWHFKSSVLEMELGESIYLARGVVERSYQIVLRSAAVPNGDGSRPPNCIRWAFRKIH